MLTKPFYITNHGPNLIQDEHIQVFGGQNPRLRPFLEQTSIELRLLPHSTFESLSFWVISQQIGGNSATKIIQRVREACPCFDPKTVLSHSPTFFRACGLSIAKAETIQRLADFILAQPKVNGITSLSSCEAIALLTQVKGIGEWTVHMHLIFSCGRMDILAAKDLVVRQGVQRLYGLKETPNEPMVRRLCSSWGSLATIGTLLAWAVKEL